MVYIEHGFNLTKAAKKRLKSVLTSDSMPDHYPLKLTKGQLVGSDVLLITQPLKKRVDKAIENEKGLTIKLSRAMLKASMKGGFLSTLFTVLPMAQELTGSLIPQSFNDKIARRMAFLNGSGIRTEGRSEAFNTLMNHYAAGKVFTKPVQKILDDLRGQGLSGSGDVKDFFNGILYGITNPIQAISMGVKEIGRAISGKGLSGNGIAFY